MRSTQQMSITLPIEMATLVKSRVSSGDYASESEVIREGLRALQERENAVEQWLRNEAAVVYDAHKTSPGRARPLDEAWESIEAQMDAIDREEGA
ncbi:type II toxin-antitoxin system ParD family antitoxin [Neorhizobium sp. T7_12]|uniref:type II toxin-antitoxin system ParD family antitoxin n=1 Tax=Neorhizobium sp. T7_12 TaxID=2093832 RepID=UPI000CF9402B|nr:type II toxin-antitoxin system ParD family antitoxin [Neorhizobium sp. T7_12]